ncbi:MULTISPECIES: hypothetical protein [unclassified Streptomyces]|uniref:hypothetical protein n=1 Tax=unclassified Streptomyces TaxID=2593676 RepID=UPI00131C0248|nr:hypothetical protein [Streptomyces sp. NRRL F-5135]
MTLPAHRSPPHIAGRPRPVLEVTPAVLVLAWWPVAGSAPGALAVALTGDTAPEAGAASNLVLPVAVVVVVAVVATYSFRKRKRRARTRTTPGGGRRDRG